jgi:predicted metal-dependent peptidase
VTPSEKILKVKTQLIFDQAFFGLILASTKCISESNEKTFATDGYNIYYNPVFVEKCNLHELRGALLHVVLHIVYMHCMSSRIGNRLQSLWHIATDYAVNLDVIDARYTLPNGCLISREYNGKNAEEIYGILNGSKSVNNLTAFDRQIVSPLDSEAEAEVETRIIAAYEAAKASAGYIPGGVEQFIKRLRESRVPWNRLFHRFIGSALAKDDYSFVKPNRRFLPQDLYLPSQNSYKVGNIVVAIDTSGSVSDDDLIQFASELKKVASLIQEVTVICCDRIVQKVTTIRDMSQFNEAAKFKGRGGTSFIPPFEEVQRRQLNPDCFIYLTDGEGNAPQQMPTYPVLWVLCRENCQKPAVWGQSVYMPRG